jgi:hypothetical protein
MKKARTTSDTSTPAIMRAIVRSAFARDEEIREAILNSERR